LTNYLGIGSVQFAVLQKTCLKRFRIILLISALILHWQGLLYRLKLLNDRNIPIP
jgi:hypothetical protein